MTDNWIIKHLESIEPTEFEEAPAVRMKFETVKQIHDLIGRQKAEIEDLIKQRDEAHTTARNAIRYNGVMRDKVNELEAEIERLTKANEAFTDIGKLYSEIKADAHKEFAERLKNIYPLHEGLNMVIDNILKELTERKDENV